MVMDLQNIDLEHYKIIEKHLEVVREFDNIDKWVIYEKLL